MKRLRYILLSFIFILTLSYVNAQSFVGPNVMDCDTAGLYIDSGVANLYLVDTATGMMTLVQTKNQSQWNPLEFFVNTAGFYIIQIIPHEGTYPNCQETWNDSALFWENANMYYLDGTPIMSWYPIIIMQSKPTPTAGSAIISGKIVAGNIGKVSGPGDPYGDVGMSLVNSGNVVGYTKTDSLGAFIFSNVDLGMYNLNANVAGISSDIGFVINITSATQVEDSIVGTVDSTGIKFKYEGGVGIMNYRIDASNLQLYPNPAAGGSHLSYSLSHAAIVSLRVYNLLGVLVSELQSGNKPPGLHQSYFEASSGTYFVELQVNGESTVRRLIMTK